MWEEGWVRGLGEDCEEGRDAKTLSQAEGRDAKASMQPAGRAETGSDGGLGRPGGA